MRELRESLRREIEELPRFEIRHSAVRGQVVLTAKVRSVPVVMVLDLAAYPAEPPRLELSPGWSWGLLQGREIRGLECQERWNRTLGIGGLLRELELRFREDPPVRRRRAVREGTSIWRTVLDRLKAFAARLFGPSAGRRDAGRATGRRARATPEAIRAKYDQVIRERTSRVRRYQQAVAELMALWQGKAAELEELGGEIERLEADQSEALAESSRAVEELRAAGESAAEIRAGEGYRRRLAAFEEREAVLEERRERFEELEVDAEELLGKIREHERRLEALMEEVEELKEEATETVAEMAAAELEREVVDALAGISRSGAAEELRRLRRQVRKAEAVVRITKEVADLGEGAGDEAYLEAARKVAAARAFEARVGLDEAPAAAASEATDDASVPE